MSDVDQIQQILAQAAADAGGDPDKFLPGPLFDTYFQSRLFAVQWGDFVGAYPSATIGAWGGLVTVGETNIRVNVYYQQQ